MRTSDATWLSPALVCLLLVGTFPAVAQGQSAGVWVAARKGKSKGKSKSKRKPKGKPGAGSDVLDPELPNDLELAPLEGNRSKGELQMLGPDTLTVGLDTLAEIHMNPPKEGVVPTLVASVGKVGQPAKMAGGLVSTYTPPGDGSAAVAIVAALKPDGSLWDWLLIPLKAADQVDVKGIPKGEVTVHIGDTSFGPTATDRRGKARVSIVYPPGVDTAMAVFQKGDRTQEVAIKLPPTRFNRMLSVCEPDRLTLLVVSPAGTLQPGQQFRFKGSASFGTPKEKQPGVYEVYFRPNADVSLGKSIKLSAALVGARGSGRSCSVRVHAGRAAAAQIEVIPDTYIAGSGAKVEVRVTVKDSSDRPARANNVTLNTDFGKLETPRSVAPGEIVTTWDLPDSFSGRQRAFVVAKVGGENPSKSEAGLTLQPGRVVKLVATSEDESLRANGRSTTVLKVTPVDTHGNVAVNAELVATALGSVGEFRGPSGGRFEATYTAPKRYGDESDKVRISDAQSGLSAEVDVKLEGARRPFLIGAKGGLTTNFGPVTTGIGLVEIGYRLPFAGESMRIGIEGGFFKRASDRSVAGAASGVEVDVWAVPLVARLAWGFRLSSSIELAVGGAAGVYLVGADSTPEDATSPVRPISVVDAVFGAGGSLGLEVTLGPGQLVLETQYNYAAISGVVDGDIAGFAGLVGYRLGI